MIILTFSVLMPDRRYWPAFPEGKISVQHLNVRTKSLFTPLKLLSPITGLPSEVYQVNENAEHIPVKQKASR